MIGWQLVRQLATPHAVYGLDWSAKGDRFAFAGGYFYGEGFVGVAGSETQDLAPHTWTQPRLVAAQYGRASEDIRAELIVSSVAFAASGERELVVAAACGYKWHARGPLSFACEADELRLLDPHFENPEEDDESDDEDEDDEPVERQQAIGAWLHHGRILVHHRAISLEGTLAVHTCRDADAHGTERDLARSNARLAVIDDQLWIAKNRAKVYSNRGTGAPIVPGSDARLIEAGNPHGLICWDLRGAAPQLREQIDLPTAWRVNAIVRDLAGTRLWLGLADHGLVEFELESGRLTRVAEQPRGRGGAPVLVRGVLALACTPAGDLVAAEQNGAIGFWREGRRVAELQLPSGLSPRSLAVDPSGERLLIGCKRHEGHNPGAVLVFERSAH